MLIKSVDFIMMLHKFHCVYFYHANLICLLTLISPYFHFSSFQKIYANIFIYNVIQAQQQKCDKILDFIEFCSFI